MVECLRQGIQDSFYKHAAEAERLVSIAYGELLLEHQV